MQTLTHQLILIIFVAMLASCNVQQGVAQISSYMPEESAPHEGTWLQWPHHFTYGYQFRRDIESSWVDMTRVLIQSENVHIVAYNQTERRRIRNVLRRAGIPMSRIDFVVRRSDDFWIRDNGPIFVRDLQDGQLVIADWGFNGWGYDAPFTRDNTVPIGIANQRGFTRFDLNELVIEGGAIEVDGNGVLMATRSSIIEPNRNPGWTQQEIESYLTGILGVTKFIWLDGKDGGEDDITDTHIDGFARFASANTIITLNRRDLKYWGLSNRDIGQLYNAKDTNGKRYRRILLPLTRRNVRTTYGQNTGVKGSYTNFYIANGHVLMPTYGDPKRCCRQTHLAIRFPQSNRRRHRLSKRVLVRRYDSLCHATATRRKIVTIEGRGHHVRVCFQ